MSKFIEVKGDKLVRNFKNCPKCGDGFWMGEHSDRSTCGKCGYTDFKSKGKKRN
ncbi:MAG: 30S ribosomal protein S27ae [Candidatus Heimdallarchaeota archaeon]|nr:30S ribosomal protein S27ae [Candidatus Heimdallarchaeota archaeon]